MERVGEITDIIIIHLPCNEQMEWCKSVAFKKHVFKS